MKCAYLHDLAPNLTDSAHSRVRHAHRPDSRVKANDAPVYVMPHQHMTVEPEFDAYRPATSPLGAQGRVKGSLMCWARGCRGLNLGY